MDELNLDPDQLERYARQLVLDGFGADGQAAVRDARVLVVGAGGLGSPAIMYLAGAGVGEFVIVDDDVVERSNLHRQIIHGVDDLGRPKVASAADWIEAHNPDVSVDARHDELTQATVDDVLAGVDVVVDATDRFDARFMLNDATVLAEIPLVYGAVYRFEGQVGTFDPRGDGPCYRCLFPEAPPPDTVADCATAGVLGPVPGTIGAMQAAQALSALIDGEPSDSSRLLVVDLAAFDIDTLEVEANPGCPVCGDDPAIESVDDVAYTGRCAIE